MLRNLDPSFCHYFLCHLSYRQQFVWYPGYYGYQFHAALSLAQLLSPSVALLAKLVCDIFSWLPLATINWQTSVKKPTQQSRSAKPDNPNHTKNPANLTQETQYNKPNECNRAKPNIIEMTRSDTLQLLLENRTILFVFVLYCLTEIKR